MSRTRRGQSGFTLIELLVVIVIMSLIMVMLTGGQRFAARAWETEERLIDRQGDLSAVQTVLRTMLISGHGFEGDDGSVRFVGTMPRSLDRAGWFDIEIKAVNDRMVLSWRPHYASAAPPGPDPTVTPLVEGIASLDVSYFIGDPASGPGGWKTAQTDKSKTPALIRIALKLSNGRAWTPLIAAPMIEPAADAAKTGS